MENLYASDAMASGYARWRPAVHPHVIGIIQKRLGISTKLRRALDVGCGSGLSTAALDPVADQCIGLEPAEGMLRWATTAAPRAHVAVSRAEQLPIAARSINLMTAAGSLNYVDLDRFFPEARRVLVDGGYLCVYDFGPGRSFVDSSGLDEWYREFERRYPFPPCRDISPDDLDAKRYGLAAAGHEQFEASLPVTAAFYVEYAMTETSVADAIRRGTSEAVIRAWCERTIPPLFGPEPRGVKFAGYIAYLQAV